MNKEQIVKKLEQYDQMQLLRFFDELTEEEQEGLLAEIDRIDFDMINIHNQTENKGTIAPIDAMTLSEIEAQKDEIRETGLRAIREGEAAAVLLAGGQGTRLGIDGPKGTLNVGQTRELYTWWKRF